MHIQMYTCMSTTRATRDGAACKMPTAHGMEFSRPTMCAVSTPTWSSKARAMSTAPPLATTASALREPFLPGDGPKPGRYGAIHLRVVVEEEEEEKEEEGEAGGGGGKGGKEEEEEEEKKKLLRDKRK